MKKHHKALVHVVLLVAVKEGRAWVVGGELDLHLRFGFNEHYIFDQAAEIGILRNAANLEIVPVQVDGVVIAARIFESQPVALTAIERHGTGVGPGFAVDHPMIGRTVTCEPGLKDERDVDYVS